MKKTFEDYLKDVHAEDYHGTDDDMPDAFDSWVSELDGTDLQDYAEAYGGEQYQAGYSEGSRDGSRTSSV